MQALDLSTYLSTMAGHSKWKQIKHKKAISDSKKSAVFSKLAKLISIAARDNQDIQTNIRLQSIVSRARASNMPRDNIERAISKARDKENASIKEIIVQATGPFNSAFIIEAITDNSNRTMQELKKIFTDYNLKMASEGSLDWMFRKTAWTEYRSPKNNDMALTDSLIELGADDLEIDQEDQTQIVYHDSSISALVADTIKNHQGEILNQENGYIAKEPITLSSPEQQASILQIIEIVEDQDDTQEVITNIKLID